MTYTIPFQYPKELPVTDLRDLLVLHSVKIEEDFEAPHDGDSWGSFWVPLGTTLRAITTHLCPDRLLLPLRSGLELASLWAIPTELRSYSHRAQHKSFSLVSRRDLCLAIRDDRNRLFIESIPNP